MKNFRQSKYFFWYLHIDTNTTFIVLDIKIKIFIDLKTNIPMERIEIISNWFWYRSRLYTHLYYDLT
jgi:hypothetical protein